MSDFSLGGADTGDISDKKKENFIGCEESGIAKKDNI